MPGEYLFQGQTYSHDEIKPTVLGNIADHSIILPLAANIANLGLQMATFRRLRLKELAINSAVEGIEYRRATGKNPTMRPLETIAFTIAELAITSLDYGAFIASIFGSLGLDFPIAIPAAIAADVAIDSLIAKGIEAYKFPQQEVGGRRYRIKAAEHAATLAGVIPVLPVAPTLSFIQWYGGHEIRLHAKRI